MAKNNGMYLAAGAALVGALFYMRKAGATPGGNPPVAPPVSPPTTPGTSYPHTTPPGGTTPPVSPPTGGNANAVALAVNLKSVQTKWGVKPSKGKEDKALVMNFQSSEGLKPDGKPGPGTLLRVARYTSNLPFVQYWPTGANKKNVYAYRAELLKLAEVSNEPRASELRASADRERGQSGIVGPLA